MSEYSISKLQEEIDAKLTWLMNNNGRELHPDWVTQAIMSDHSEIEGKDADFHLCCTRVTVRDYVRRKINTLEKDTADSKQLILDGFEHLQQWYNISRNGTQVAVRVDELTDDEIDIKAGEYETMAMACIKHADELRRFKDIRRQTG